MTEDGVKTCTVFSPGTISKIDGSVPSNSAEEDWQQGIGVVYSDGEDFEIIPVSINDGEAMLNGRMYIGGNYVEDLKNETGWTNF